MCLCLLRFVVARVVLRIVADSNLLLLLVMMMQGWKDVYLRNMVAQTTHAAMLAQQQVQSLICASQVAQPVHNQQQQHNHKSNKPQQQQVSNQQSQVSQAPPRLYFTSLAHQQQRSVLLKRRAKQEVDESEEDPECPVDTQTPSLRTTTATHAAADSDWKRWRRVNFVALHERKDDTWRAAVAASLPLSPTFRMRSSASFKPSSRLRTPSKGYY